MGKDLQKFAYMVPKFFLCKFTEYEEILNTLRKIKNEATFIQGRGHNQNQRDT